MKIRIRITLPWPNPLLSPNSHVHLMARNGAKKNAIELARSATEEALNGWTPKLPENEYTRINLQLFCTPPVKRNRDEDNLIASCKSYFDGISKAMRINDHLFHFREQMWSPAKQPGELAIELEWDDENEK